MDEKRRGFGVLQCMIVVAVLVSLAAISVYLLRSRIAANEDAARESLHAYNLALFEYVNIYETYPKTLANLGAGTQMGFASAGLLDPVLASGKKNGYVFAYVPGELDFDGTSSTYNITARPPSPELQAI